MAIVNQKPSYWVTVRDNFWNFLIDEDGAARLYESDVYRAPVVKSIGLTQSVAEGNIYASGIVYDYTRLVQGAEIALDAVALDHTLINKAIGATVDGGFAYNSSMDFGHEFAFGYYLEQKNGKKIYYWHPRCLLTQDDQTVETSTDSMPDPSRSFTIQAMPTTEGIWRICYYEEDASPALTVDEFFAFCRYTNQIQASSLTLSSTVKVGTSVTATIAYADSQSPTNPTVAYSWWLASTADGEYTQIESASASSYTPAAGDEGKYLKCQAKVSGSAIGFVESAPAVVAAAS